MTREIYTYPHWVLNTKTEAIETCTEQIKELAQDMHETMNKNKGIGLAAPQVGELYQLITVDIHNEEESTGPITLLNPCIQKKEGSREIEEACLSLPGYHGKVKRASKIVVTGMDLQEQKQEFEAEGLFAVCLQHEIDHLNGITLLDHASKLKRSMYEKKIEKWSKSKN